MKTSILTLALFLSIPYSQALKMKSLQKHFIVDHDTDKYEQDYLDAFRGHTEARKEFNKQ